MTLIEARDVRKTFEEGSLTTDVLRGVDMTIEEGETTAILGSSGAGKSTLLHVLSSLDTPTSGKVFFQGAEYPADDRALSRLRNQAIGFVFQFHHLLPEFSAIENVMMPLLVRSEGWAASRQKSGDILKRLGLEHRLEHRPSEMSGGEQQRVAVARAVVTRPRILFADEPTGNLDHENGERLVDLLLQVHAETGMTLVLVTHNESVASRFSRRIRLEDGRVQGGHA